MRYTTIIDISELQAIYKSHAARLVYLHLALKAGYHDDNRDLVLTSIRRLAADVGLTVSATRCAIHQLETNKLLSRTGNVWTIRKWIDAPNITPRTLTKRQQRSLDAAAARRQEQERREVQETLDRIQREQMFAQGKTSFMIYYENLLQKAQAGDAEAAKLVAKHKDSYEQQRLQMEQRKTNGKP